MFKKLFGKKDKEEAKEEAKEEEAETTEASAEEEDTSAEAKAEEETAQTEEEQAGLFSRLKNGLSKTRNAFANQIKGLFAGYSSINDELFEELEEILIQADVGVRTTMKLVDDLRTRADEEKIKDPQQLQDVFQEKLRSILVTEDEDIYTQDQLTILMVVGVNGVGKTTTIGKIALRAKESGQQVLLVAGDTFRAAAIEQLEAWGNRVGTKVISHQEGADAAAVVYDGIQAAHSRDSDLLIIDTAGRLHTQSNLMEELKKVKRIIDQRAQGARVESLLVLDATTGQNGISQAELFDEAVGVDGIALTKLDGTAKGGIVLAIKEELGIPIKLIGVGEDVDDLQDFEAEAFIEALFN
ncbi:signal recognition particle-docking protein FtsY [Fuchsiella alkaliacetigena]|uniref:signal recognition particle-docking protein FtsY n=1 Tax=Fuchsiella alkaliacetigena TaxID=957042 RepID=UPI00200A5F4D|nr:signal recognition particle-docking protein FtsY [Fuchsiella alkaliacetigena]MCK8825861.1 signal recognition particle-docking protein FtsY [Fuchsiella alkaliacetigena]